ncbi:hypothetical protein AVEN_109123-1 [Araneus ventricosus]|uniref:RNase H type-1 domain-containing protein n=1 Tax=Araneus ventricosus TaxID=182803 RepID=A0A4Y2JNJ1_ARAVE|nr:hypothetical protein AVEN_109123-1 [Araneus ventricosus]
MDLLKLERTQLRPLFTKSFFWKEVEAVVRTEPVSKIELIPEFNILNDKTVRLFQLDEKIGVMWLEMENFEEDEFSRNIDLTENYRYHWIAMKTKVDLILSTNDGNDEISDVEIESDERLQLARSGSVKDQEFQLKGKIPTAACIVSHHSSEDSCNHSIVKRVVRDFSGHPVYKIVKEPESSSSYSLCRINQHGMLIGFSEMKSGMSAKHGLIWWGVSLPAGALPALHPSWVGRASVGIFAPHQLVLESLCILDGVIYHRIICKKLEPHNTWADLEALGEAVDWAIENKNKINISTDSRSSIEAPKSYGSRSKFVISIKNKSCLEEGSVELAWVMSQGNELAQIG